MYRLLIALAFATGGVTGCQEGTSPTKRAAPDQVPVTFNVERNPTTEFKIPALDCMECCQEANEVLADVRGVVDVYASDKSQRVIVAVDEATFDKQAAIQALEGRFGRVYEVDGGRVGAAVAP
jgi:copper chaperone CopZ